MSEDGLFTLTPNQVLLFAAIATHKGGNLINKCVEGHLNTPDMNGLITLGLIEMIPQYPPGTAPCKLSPRGRVLFDAMRALPLPIPLTTWSMP